VLEAVARGNPPRLMLLGAPGGGKSTFVNHLVLCLAGTAIAAHTMDVSQPEDDWLARLDGWQLGALLPVRVVLREFAAFPGITRAARGSLSTLLEYLRETLGAQADAFELLRSALTDGHAILLFDGLDEVVGEPALSRVVESIAETAGIYKRCPIVVTCRVLDYQSNPRRQISGFDVKVLAPLTGEQIDQFVAAWYAELAASGREALGNAAALQQALAGRAELRELAQLPLLLTMMAVVHAGKGRLPDARALLYYECIDLLLLRWRQDPGAPDVLESLQLPTFRGSDLLALMARIGYAAHVATERAAEQAAQPANLSRAQVQQLIAEAFEPYSTGDPIRRDTLVSQLLHAIAMRNGLLLKQSGEQGESYSFPHRTFQEFLAGYHLKRQRDYRRMCLEHAPQSHWHEALALMVGYQVLADGELEKPLDLAEKLLGRSPAEQALAGELLELIGRERAVNYDPTLVAKDGLWPRARLALIKLSAAGRAPAAAAALRVRAGLALGQLCYGNLETLCRADTRIPLPDPRMPLAVAGVIAPDSTGWRQALNDYWRPIAAGPFWHGDDFEKEPLRQVEITHDYVIARYPITNADFARFVAVGGYAEQRWWTAPGWAWLQGEQISQPRSFDDMRYNNPLQPVGGVAWYEATAYCTWLTELGRSRGWLPEGDSIRLPTWLEWERAARHIDRRRYPWGSDEPNVERANYRDTGLGYPSPIGCFPAGTAVCGAQDMVGNLQEWTATPVGQSKQVLSLREGLSRSCYLLGVESLCCGTRGGLDPKYWRNVQGFRVVLSRA
jgi:formylglycine-generating enzyme required for sulfatase activity